MSGCNQSIRIRHYGLILASAGALSGCLILPTPELSEIRDSKLEFIEPGQTTRRSVEAELLSDDVFIAYDTPPYAIYAEYRDSFLVASTSASQTYGNVDDYLVVRYDSRDIVVRFDRIRREGGCTDYGLCVSGGSEPSRNEDARRNPASLIVRLPPD